MLAVALLLALAGCGSSEEKAVKAAARFDGLYATRDYLAARVEISKAIAAQDDVPEYWAKLARVQLALGQYLEAHDAYSHVIELDKNDPEAIQALAELSYSGGSYEDSEKLADQMLAMQPRSLRMLLVKGSIAAARGQLADAEAIASGMLEIDPANEGGTILLARVRAQQGDRRAAVALLDASVAKDGESVPKLMALLDLHGALGDFPGSARTYARLFALKPDDIDLRLEYVKTLYGQDMPDRALAMLARLTHGRPGDVALQERIVDIWTDAGSDKVDVDAVRRFVNAGGDAPLKIALGHLLLDQKRFAEAEAQLRPFVDGKDITAGNVEADVLYAGALAGLGRGGEALSLIDRILAFDGSNPRALLMRVRVSLAAGELPRALRDAQLLVRDNPAMVDGRVALADIYVRRKERVLADDVYARAMNELMKDPAMLAAYIRYLLETGRGAMAKNAAQRFTHTNDRMLDGWLQRAELCMRLGDPECEKEATFVLDQLPGGARVHKALEAERATIAPAAVVGRPAAVQSAVDCGRTGARC